MALNQSPDPNEYPPGDGWGSEDLDETDVEAELEDDLGAPPPAPTKFATEKPAPPPESMVSLGPPPRNAMAAAKWAYELLMLQAHETMLDPDLTQSSRRKEVRVILASAAKHMTDAMRYDTMRMIEEDRAVLEKRKRGKAAAKLVARPAGAAGAKIIPIVRGA